MLLFWSSGGDDAEDLPFLEAFTRQLIDLLPPGRIWKLIGDTLLRRFLMASAAELARVRARSIDLYREANAGTADELLPEWEADFDLHPGDSDTLAVRRARVVARQVARQRVRPADYQRALAPVLALDPEDIEVWEMLSASAVAQLHPRDVYWFFIRRDPDLPGTGDLVGAQALVDQISHSQTKGTVFESTTLICDDEHSGCDRDLLGA